MERSPLPFLGKGREGNENSERPRGREGNENSEAGDEEEGVF